MNQKGNGYGMSGMNRIRDSLLLLILL